MSAVFIWWLLVAFCNSFAVCGWGMNLLTPRYQILFFIATVLADDYTAATYADFMCDDLVLASSVRSFKLKTRAGVWTGAYSSATYCRRW